MRCGSDLHQPKLGPRRTRHPLRPLAPGLTPDEVLEKKIKTKIRTGASQVPAKV
ncbi:hypothetical protein IQ26_06847 [Mesorhizobium tianshanense]|uniref:Uncharacterized protein n=1 Tax=Mesorhizobium tianshanense TaxID=39844 RepID=A0A562MNG1_9HYPH|nr:hypothetical protein IQ26_06847 [Mesorhizobium tianshanense]